MDNEDWALEPDEEAKLHNDSTEAADEPRDPSRANLTEKESRIVRIMGMMECLEFRGAQHIPELAVEWRVDRKTVERYAAEASRWIRMMVRKDPEDMRTEIAGALRRNAQDARAQERPDFNASTRALDSLAELVGLKRARLEIELASDIDRKLEALSEKLPPEVYRTVAAVLCGQAVDDGGETDDTGEGS